MGGSRRFAKNGDDRVAHSFDIPHDVGVPEPHHSKALGVKPGSTAFVGIDMDCFGVLAAIKFDNEPRREASEIDDIRSKRNLTAETEAPELSSPQRLPEFAFGLRRVAAQFARSD